MRILLTGIAGFAGSHLAERLLAEGDEVWGLVADLRETVNLTDCLAGPRASRLTLAAGDLLDQPLLEALLAEARPDQVYHLAALASVRHSQANPAETFRVNVLGTRTLLEAVREWGGCPRILLVGSAEAYGESAAGPAPLTECDPLLPVSPYGVSKAAAEWLACRYGQEAGLAIIRVRPFPHTGPRHAPVFVFPDLARQVAEAEAGRRSPRLEVGDLTVRRDLTDVRDMVAAYTAALSRGEAGSVYNLCSGRVVSLREVLDSLIRLAGIPIEVAVCGERMRPHDLPVLAGSGRKFCDRTGWSATHSLESTLRGLLDYWRIRVASAAGR